MLLTVASFLTRTLGFTSVQAQEFASSAAYAPGIGGTTPAASTEKVVPVGKINNSAGGLPSTVVILTATKQMAVTNANAEFEFTVPADAGALDAVVTYAAADESTVSLTNARVIVMSRKQQLKKAHKQVKRELKQFRK
ncbi:hypothetical protein [Hymenobacter terricola]|uniref:hypothetical protein n=1 Tax=Hymenobacter terricola TaxID=2819236 RepID=UPI001B301331|nr:hypothetical protein [Hymenobacter terricola]